MIHLSTTSRLLGINLKLSEANTGFKIYFSPRLNFIGVGATELVFNTNTDNKITLVEL